MWSYWNADILQILVEARHRWLRPAEICEILRNYKQFRVAPEPQHRPPSKCFCFWLLELFCSTSFASSSNIYFSGGSLLLFDRKALRYFRKDGHNWRKKKDGKTIKEAHEKLKVSISNDNWVFYFDGLNSR